MSFKKIAKLITPPIIIKGYNRISKNFKKTIKFIKKGDPNHQDLDMYYNEDFANMLETWGEKNVWREIQLIMSACEGKVVDVACGTGVNIKDLEKFSNIEVHGFDISELLISRAIKKGISPDRLKVMDATKTTYSNNEFDYSYSIGSLEHFTEEGIDLFLAENARYTRKIAFHMIPVSLSGKDEGWLKYIQSFFNNSTGWWLQRFKKRFSKVIPIQSKWADEGVSIGVWFICYK